MKKFLDNNRILYAMIAISVILVLGGMLGFSFYLNHKAGEREVRPKDSAVYSYHVAIISENSSDIFWQSLYEGARKEGEKEGIYPENFGADLNEEYTAEELMRMAVASKVDGIMVECDESAEMQEEIRRATDAGIPVITMLNDDPDSGRISYVGMNHYSLGEIYGREVLDAAGGKESRVAVLVPINNEETSPNNIYSGISEAIAGTSKEIEVSTVRTGEDKEFVSEEAVRNLLVDTKSRPDILVCLSATDTISAYQCVRDYNLVGEVKIIGYYTSPEILEGIQNGVIKSTIVTDAGEIGILGIQAMKEYLTQSYTNEYFPVSVILIDKKNVNQYIAEGGE